MLLIEVSHETPHNIADLWKFPKTINLMSKTKSRLGVSYELTGRVLYSRIRGHYTARFMQKRSNNRIQVVEHDGLEQEGCSRIIQGAKLDTHLAGQHANLQHVHPGYHTAVVIYHLRGGIEAQKAFLAHHTSEYSSKLKVAVHYGDVGSLKSAGVTFTKPGFKMLSPRLSASPGPWLEYEATAQPSEEVLEPACGAAAIDSTDTIDADDYAGIFDTPQALGSAQTAPTMDDSLPVNCRCGVSGEGSHLLDDLQAIECRECRKWSHIACQRDGHGSICQKTGQKFICDSCSFDDFHVENTRL